MRLFDRFSCCKSPSSFGCHFSVSIGIRPSPVQMLLFASPHLLLQMDAGSGKLMNELFIRGLDLNYWCSVPFQFVIYQLIHFETYIFHHLQSSTHLIEDDIDIELAEKQTESPVEAEALKRVISSNGKEVNTFSAEHIDRLIFLSSRPKSWHSQDDEAVDLTEPRFESFCMENL